MFAISELFQAVAAVLVALFARTSLTLFATTMVLVPALCVAAAIHGGRQLRAHS